MGLVLEHRESDGKWRAWTTISDGWLTKWLTENEMKSYLIGRRDRQHKLDTIELLMSFPHGYYDKDSYRVFSGPIMAFHEWNGKVLKDYATYDAKVDEKYKELTALLDGSSIIDINDLATTLMQMEEKPRDPIFEVVKAEMKRRGRWKAKPRGKPMTKGHDPRRAGV